MKKAVVGFVWFLVLYLGAFGIGVAVIGGIAGANAKGASAYDEIDDAYAAGYQAGAEFGKRYRRIFFGGALILAIAGTVTGRLPGTKDRIDN
ncbi:MAG: hypothetical protein ACU83V_00500 [Gammaproteobacteria bacterium]